LLQSFPERQKDVTWIGEREGMSDGRVGEKTPILLSVLTSLKHLRLGFYNIFTLIEIYKLGYTLKVSILFNST